MIPVVPAREKKLLDQENRRRRRKKKGRSGPENPGRGSDLTDYPIIPELELESFQPPEPPQDVRTGSIRFGWIGTGKCGGRLVEAFRKLGYTKTVAVDTSAEDLNALNLPRRQKFHMDIGQENEGNDIACGREAIETCGHDLFGRMEEIFDDQVDHLMICLGAGGGTGSGSAPGLIELALNYTRLLRFQKPHQRVGVLMALPSINFVRSKPAAANASAVIRKLTQLAEQNQISPLILADNNMIKRLFPKLVREYWQTVNYNMAGLFDTFNKLSCSPSPYTSFDSMDYSHMLTAGGCTAMSVAEIKNCEDKRSISQAIRSSLKTGLLTSDYDLCKAKAAACVVVGSRKIMTEAAGLQDNINYGFDFLTAVTGKALVHRGIYEDEYDSLRIYTMISGLPAPQRRLKKHQS